MKKDYQQNILWKLPFFPGASTDGTHHYLRPLLQKCSDTIILHVGTNNCVNESSHVVLDKTFNIKAFIRNSLLQCKAIIYIVINRTDYGEASLTTEFPRNHLKSLKLDIADNSTIGKEFLGKKGWHLTKRGTGKLAINFMFSYFGQFSCHKFSSISNSEPK